MIRIVNHEEEASLPYRLENIPFEVFFTRHALQSAYDRELDLRLIGDLCLEAGSTLISFPSSTTFALVKEDFGMSIIGSIEAHAEDIIFTLKTVMDFIPRTRRGDYQFYDCHVITL